MPLPTILETDANLLASIKSGGAQRLAGDAGTETVVRIYECSGLTSTYTRTLRAHASGIVIAAKWTHARIGGTGAAEILVKGGLADMDDAIKNEWEIELERGDPTVWYRGRIVGYKHETAGDGEIMTRLFCEGYLTKLSQIKVTADYTSSTVKVIVQAILDTYVTPNTRIAYAAGDVVGAYVVNSVSFKDRTVLEAFEMLGMMQGSTEWGVTEGNPKPQFYFLADGTGTSETQVVQLEKDAQRLTTEGSFEVGYSTVKVIGGWTTGGAVITGTYTDSTAQTTYGKREKVFHDSSILNASDANRIAQNYATVYANGVSRYQVDVISPTTRIEPDRTSTIAAAKKMTLRGVDGTQVTDFFGLIEYQYLRPPNPGTPLLIAKVRAGVPEECVQAHVTRLARTVESLVQQAQQFTQGSGANHNLLSTTHPDSTAGTVVQGDLMAGVGATPKWERLAHPGGSSGKLLRTSGAALAWSTLTFPNTITQYALLWGSATDQVSEFNTVASSVLQTDANGALYWSSSLIAGTTLAGETIPTTSSSSTYTGTTTLSQASVQNLKTLANGSVELGSTGALATSAVDGFAYNATMAGAPSGTPTSVTGKTPFVVDTSNGRIYLYYGDAWHYATLT